MISSLQRQSTTLLLVDIQEKLLAAMDQNEAPSLVRQLGILVDGAKVLGLPILATEQYPKGLGPTIPSLKEKLAEAPIEKMEFSAFANERARDALKAHKTNSVILCGMETHVCVYQTARDLLSHGFHVFIPEEAVLSRRDVNVRVGLGLCERAGAVITSVETILFEMVGSASDKSFKEISRLIR
jgi:nicotinamidase-related amidase